MGLSDGARIDTIRRAYSGVLSNEQFVFSTQVDTEKWRDLLDSLRDDLQDPAARFRLVYLIDDFTGTGTSFLRFDKEKNKWKGKLIASLTQRRAPTKSFATTSCSPTIGYLGSTTT